MVWIIAIIWYVIGLYGSHIVISEGDYTSWKGKEEFWFGILTAFAGPINLIAAIIGLLEK